MFLAWGAVRLPWQNANFNVVGGVRSPVRSSMWLRPTGVLTRLNSAFLLSGREGQRTLKLMTVLSGFGQRI